MTQPLPAPGTLARFDLDSGDRYVGEVVETHGPLVTVRAYSAWYDGDAAPYSSPYSDDTARFQVDDKTRVSAL